MTTAWSIGRWTTRRSGCGAAKKMLKKAFSKTFRAMAMTRESRIPKRSRCWNPRSKPLCRWRIRRRSAARRRNGSPTISCRKSNFQSFPFATPCGTSGGSICGTMERSITRRSAVSIRISVQRMNKSLTGNHLSWKRTAIRRARFSAVWARFLRT